jgi:hypothetical protein
MPTISTSDSAGPETLGTDAGFMALPKGSKAER